MHGFAVALLDASAPRRLIRPACARRTAMTLGLRGARRHGEMLNFTTPQLPSAPGKT